MKASQKRAFVFDFSRHVIILTLSQLAEIAHTVIESFNFQI